MFTEDDSQSPVHDLIVAIRRLAAAGSDQPPLFPDEDVSPIELVRDFDQRASVVREAGEDRLSASQIESLTLLEQKLSTMARDGAEFDADIWTEEAVRTGEQWAEVRRLAAATLEEFTQ
jgi:hypothetical protein